MAVKYRANIVSVTQLDQIGQGISGRSGFYADEGAVTAQSPEAMAVNVAAITASSSIINGTVETSAIIAAAQTIADADATNPRLDMVTWRNDGSVHVISGTAAEDPVPPAIPASDIELAMVHVATGADAIASSAITDRRILLDNDESASVPSRRRLGTGGRHAAAGNHGHGSSGDDLSEDDVDARVRAGVLDWAEQGNTSAIPAAKLTNASSSGHAHDLVGTVLTQAEYDALTPDAGRVYWIVG